jgi:hypothetical protein
MANRQDIEALERIRLSSWMEKLPTEELLDGLRLRSFRGGGNTVAREILRERNALPDGE